MKTFEQYQNKTNFDTPTKIKIGKTYSTPSGKITITNIEVVQFHRTNFDVRVEYEYETEDGKKGIETNSVSSLQKNIFMM